MSIEKFAASAAAELRKLADEEGFDCASIDEIVIDFQLWFPYIFERLIDQAAEFGREFDPEWAKRLICFVFIEMMLRRPEVRYIPSTPSSRLN